MLRNALLKCIILATLPSWAGQTERPKHLDEAVKLLNSLQPDQTSYRHKETKVKWASEKSDSPSECHTDCSGFVNSLIHHTYPKLNVEAFKKWFGKPRPLADTYYDTFVAQKGFTRISKIGDLLPGDIIAIKYPPGNDNTGHVMLISGLPRPHSVSAPIVAGTQQWEVPIIDASISGHGKTDSRRKADGTFRNGLGTGNLRLYSKAGVVVGYSWSVVSASEFHDDKTRPLAVGRIDTTFQP